MIHVFVHHYCPIFSLIKGSTECTRSHGHNTSLHLRPISHCILCFLNCCRVSASFIALNCISGGQHGTIVQNELTRAANMSHVSCTGTSLGPCELHSCPCGMSRGKKSQQRWACGQSRHVSAILCCRDFAEISAERKNGCRVAQIFRVPKCWDGKTEKTCIFLACHFLGGRLGLFWHWDCGLRHRLKNTLIKTSTF